MELSERMERNLSLARPCKRIADIGCDHGFVSIELIRRGICEQVIAADVREGPLQRAAEHIREAGLEDVIETRLSDGFEKILPGEVQGCIIAGMGGPLMEKILTEGMDRIRKMEFLVLQPQSEVEEFRSFLREKGFRIERNEILCDDGKYYFAMLAVPGEKREEKPEEEEHSDFYRKLSDRYGEDLLSEDRGLGEYLLDEYERLTNVITSLQSAEKDREKRMEEIHGLLNLIRTAQCILASYREPGKS